jgi:hypothetical protein
MIIINITIILKVNIIIIIKVNIIIIIKVNIIIIIKVNIIIIIKVNNNYNRCNITIYWIRLIKKYKAQLKYHLLI